MLGGWQNNPGGPPSPYNRGQYPAQQPGAQPWNSGAQRPPGPPGPPGPGGPASGPGQWEQHRYPQQGQPGPYASNQQVTPQFESL